MSKLKSFTSLLILILSVFTTKTNGQQKQNHGQPITRPDISISKLNISKFTYVKEGNNWNCSVTCIGEIRYVGRKDLANVTVDFSYNFMSPNSGLKSHFKTISDKVKLNKVFVNTITPFKKKIEFKIPVATNTTGYPDPEIYLCNDIFTANIKRISGELNIKNNTKKWNGLGCLY